MKLKTRLNKLAKSMNSTRPEEYLELLKIRLENKRYRYSNALVKWSEKYPRYVFNYFYPFLQSYYDVYRTRDVKTILNRIKYLDKCWETLKTTFWYVDNRYENVFPQYRKHIDFDKVKFVKVRDILNNDFIGFVSYYSDRGNGEYDIKVYGTFFDENGHEADIERFDNTYLVRPMEDDNDYKRFINLYSKTNTMTKSTVDSQMNTYNTLNDYWCSQLTYLKQKNDETLEEN